MKLGHSDSVCGWKGGGKGWDTRESGLGGSRISGNRARVGTNSAGIQREQSGKVQNLGKPSACQHELGWDSARMI